MIQIVDSEIRERYFPGLASLGILRLDLPDPVGGGNKIYKQKYHIEAFQHSGAKAILTFGGAFSNHIAAMAYAGKKHSIPMIGIIRGEELKPESNAVLQFASTSGMQLHFVSREEYGRRYSAEHHAELKQRFNDVHIIPEGGAGEEGIRGCMEILNDETEPYDEIVVPVGTGSTLAGLIRSARSHQHLTGIAVGNFELSLDKTASVIVNGSVNYDHTLGGYAKSSNALDDFIGAMKNELCLPLDHVYSGKTLFGIHNITKNGGFPGKNLLFVHTGGYAFTKSHFVVSGGNS